MTMVAGPCCAAGAVVVTFGACLASCPHVGHVSCGMGRQNSVHLWSFIYVFVCLFGGGRCPARHPALDVCRPT